MKSIRLSFASLALVAAGWLVATAGAIVNGAAPEDAANVKPPESSGRAVGEAAGRSTRDWYPFRGEVASIDVAGGAIGLRRQSGERVVKVNPESELKREGQAVSLAEVRVGEYIHGKIRKGDSGQEAIVSAALDPEPPAKKPAKAKARPDGEGRKASGETKATGAQ